MNVSENISNKKLKILMLVEYFKPFDFGGSEWSTLELSTGLSKKFDIFIMTPNYGKAPSSEKINGIEIIRFPFYKKIRNHNQLSPFWQSNLLWLLWTSIFVLYYSIKNKIDIIHVQGKYLLPAGAISKLITRKKIIITLRDYIILCPLGICLTTQDRSCDFFGFIKNEFSQYTSLYLKTKNPFKLCFFFLATLRGRLNSYFLFFLLNFVDKKISVSNLVKGIYKNSGIGQITTIYNPIKIQPNRKIATKGQRIIFAGRLTPGKGVHYLVKAIPSILKNFPQVQFEFYGEGFYKNILEKLVKEMRIEKNVLFFKYINHEDLINAIKNSTAVVIPSLWPEPFSRVGLEALAALTPVVVTKRTGNAEFLKEGEWGYTTEPNPTAIALAIKKALRENDKLKNNLRRDAKSLSKKLWIDSIHAYENIYKSLV